MAQPARPFANKRDKSLPALAGELWQLIVAYLKQETVEPVKGLGRFVGLGIGGALLLAIGLLLLAIAGLRALQVETGSHFTGNWSWLPYVIVLFGAAVFAAIAAGRIGGGKGKAAGGRGGGRSRGKGRR